MGGTSLYVWKTLILYLWFAGSFRQVLLLSEFSAVRSGLCEKWPLTSSILRGSDLREIQHGGHQSPSFCLGSQRRYAELVSNSCYTTCCVTMDKLLTSPSFILFNCNMKIFCPSSERNCSLPNLTFPSQPEAERLLLLDQRCKLEKPFSFRLCPVTCSSSREGRWIVWLVGREQVNTCSASLPLGRGGPAQPWVAAACRVCSSVWATCSPDPRDGPPSRATLTTQGALCQLLHLGRGRGKSGQPALRIWTSLIQEEIVQI